MEDFNSIAQIADPGAQASADRTSAIRTRFMADVVAGLSRRNKRLDCKYLYDERGSVLFDRICELDAYYPTRVESGIMREHAAEIGAGLGSHAILVELGSGSSLKTRLLLSHLSEPQAYLPVDISEEHLLATSRKLQQEYPMLKVRPVVADFTHRFDIPRRFKTETTSVYFPGSTIGNLKAADAGSLLENLASICGADGGVLMGYDLVKDIPVLERAYNDEHGITAEFNLNLLQRMNRELQADFVLDQFAHVAFFNAAASRIEIYIESLVDQLVVIDARAFRFQAGERILTEYSHKYTLDGFAEMAVQSGLHMQRCWTDKRRYFAVAYFTAG